MKPTNDFERIVDNLRLHLKPINEKDGNKIQLMFDEMDDEAVCSMLDEKGWNKSYGIKEYRHHAYLQSYFTKIETIKGLQVVRMFSLELRKTGLSTFPKTRYKEVLQKWYGDNGQSAIVACKFQSFKYGFDDWAFGSELALRHPHIGNNYQERTSYTHVAKNENTTVASFAPFLKKYGLSSSTPMIKQMNIANAIELSQHFVGEYLLKNNGHQLFAMIANGYIELSRVERVLPSLKICYRHGYTIADISLWLDLLRFLEKMGKDIHSPKYIMPLDLWKAHDFWHKKADEAERRRIYKEKMEDARKHEKDYYNAKKHFFGLSFNTASGLVIHSVESVAEMIEEGEAMHHCVGCYWSHNNSLILVCRSPHNERIATIEVRIDTLKVAQIRGLQNKKPNEFEEIMESVNNNMKLIRERRDNPDRFNPKAIDDLRDAA